VGRFNHTPWAVPWEDAGAAQGEYSSPTAAVIRMAGYPLQTYTVVTEDGYVLKMERIPRPGAPDVALFMHGALSTGVGVGAAWWVGGVCSKQLTCPCSHMHTHPLCSHTHTLTHSYPPQVCWTRR